MIDLFKTKIYKLYEEDFLEFLENNKLEEKSEENFRLFYYAMLSYIEKHLFFILLFDEFRINNKILAYILDDKENRRDFDADLDFCISRQKMIKFCNSKFRQIFFKKKVKKDKEYLINIISKEKIEVENRVRNYEYKERVLNLKGITNLWSLK